MNGTASSQRTAGTASWAEDRFLNLAILALVISTVVFIAIVAQLKAPVYFHHVLYNPGFHYPWLLPYAAAFVVAVTFFSRNLPTTVGVALAAGGFIANTLVRTHIGPVADYIPLHWLTGANTRCDFADLCGVAGGLVLFFALVVNFLKPEPN